MKRKRVLSFILANLLILSNISPNLQYAYAAAEEDMSEVEVFGEGTEGYGGVEDFNTGTSKQEESTQPTNEVQGGSEPVNVSQKVEDIQGNNQNSDAASSQDQTAQNTATLSSTSFDLSKGSVSIWDDTNNPGKALIEYNGEQYPNVNSTYFEFVGSSNANKISIMTDREYTILLKDLNLSTDIPITLYGNGKINLYIDKTVNLSTKSTALFTSGKVTVDVNFYENSYLKTNGNIGATDDGTQIIINNGYISGSKLFTGKNVIVKGGSFDVPISNAVNVIKGKDGAEDKTLNLYPVTLEGLKKETTYNPTITLDGDAYSYGFFNSNKNGKATLYLPKGNLVVTVGDIVYEGTSTEDGVTLDVKEGETSVVESTSDEEQSSELNVEEVEDIGAEDLNLLDETSIGGDQTTNEDVSFFDDGTSSSNISEAQTQETSATSDSDEDAFFDEEPVETEAKETEAPVETEAVVETEAATETEAIAEAIEAVETETEAVVETEAIVEATEAV